MKLDDFSDSLEADALEFATLAHFGQKRKYTGEDYIWHPVEVARIVKTVPHTNKMVAAALLHDVVEDTQFTIDDIFERFGEEVANMVYELTDISKPEDGNRAARKAIDARHSANASTNSQTIKLADTISNAKSILEHDTKFSRVYIPEMVMRLRVMNKGDQTLYNKASDIVFNGVQKLGLTIGGF